MSLIAEVFLPLSLRAPLLILFGVQGWRLIVACFPELIEPFLFEGGVTALRSEGRRVAWWLLGWYALGVVLSSQMNLGWAALWLWAALVAWILCPVSWIGISLRGVFIRSLARCLFSWPGQVTGFGEVMLADVLCSYAKVMADWDALFWCHLLVRGASSVDSCVPSLLSVVFVCLPYACRLRQCLADWLATRQTRHLVNAVKYGCSFPTFYLTHLFSVKQQVGMNWWIFWLTINWALSVGWDTLMDWALLRDRRGLRPKLYFRPTLYYVATAVNAALRAVWVVRMAALLLGWHSMARWWDDAGLLMPTVEIGRRFLWFLFRLDAELNYYRQPAIKYSIMT